MRFTKFNSKNSTFQTLFQKTINRNDSNLIIDIPEEENVTYYLEQIAFNSYNEVLKKEIHLVFVPYNELNARIQIDKAIYSSEDTILVTLENIGINNINTGIEFEKWNGNKWNKFNDKQMIPAIMGPIIKTGESFIEEIVLNEFDKGLYRVVMRWSSDQEIAVAFRVE